MNIRDETFLIVAETILTGAHRRFMRAINRGNITAAINEKEIALANLDGIKAILLESGHRQSAGYNFVDQCYQTITAWTPMP